MSRIDFLKAQIVHSRALEKTMSKSSPSRAFLERSRAEFEQELDSWLNLPKEKPAPKSQEPSHLVEQLVQQLYAADLVPVVTEFRFHPNRKWRFDLAWPDFKIAVEVHGGIHSGGRHTRGAGFQADREKMNEAQVLGWIVLEVTAEQIRSGQALGWIERALEVRGGH